MEIESRLLPCGLHVVGSPPTAMEAIATLVNIAEIDRPEGDPPVKGLPGILARSINRNMEEIYLNNNRVCSGLHRMELSTQMRALMKFSTQTDALRCSSENLSKSLSCNAWLWCWLHQQQHAARLYVRLFFTPLPVPELRWQWIIVPVKGFALLSSLLCDHVSRILWLPGMLLASSFLL